MKYNSNQELMIHKTATCGSLAKSICNDDSSKLKQIIFIDSQVEDMKTLASGVLPGIDIVILDNHHNGIEQITSVLSHKNKIDSIHIVSHGSPGCLYLGNTQLSLDTLDKYQSDLKTWFNPPAYSTPLHKGGRGDLFLYGCNVAAGDAGAEFISKLSQLTGLEIAASTTPIGNAVRGGNWKLDVNTNHQEHNLAFSKELQENYGGVFATVNYNNNDSEATADYETITKTFDVSNDLIITDINLGLNLAHDYRASLDITLQHPDGTTIQLSVEDGDGAQNLYILFDDQASINILDDYSDHSTPGYINLRIPQEALSAFDGKSSLGTWTLVITDTDGFGDIGQYNDSQLTIEGTSQNVQEVTEPIIPGSIWLDGNNNGQYDDGESGLDGVIVNLYQDLDQDGIIDGVIVATETSSNGGYYDFGDLTVENYLVEIAAANFETGNALSGMENSTSGETNDQSPVTLDFGFAPVIVNPYKISGTVLNNTQAPELSEIDNPGDTPLENVTLELFLDDGSGNLTGNAIASTTTDVNGFYEFTNLANGNYVIIQQQPDGYDSVTDIDGIDDNKILATIAEMDAINQDFLEEASINYINGTAYNDDLSGSEHNDYVDAQAGNDQLRGSLGADTLIGGSGSDSVNYNDSASSVTVDLENNIAIGGDAEGDIFDSIEHLSGSQFSDLLIADENNNELYGANGDDIMMGNGGNDYLSGQDDHDSIEGGTGNDIIYGGNGQDTLIGGVDNDFLSGGQGDDSLTGASVINNGRGEVDRFLGGSGADIFVLGTENDVFYDDDDNTSNGINDYVIIMDFDLSEDVIQISGNVNYYLDTNPIGAVFGAGLFIDNDGINGISSEDDLVGLLTVPSWTTDIIDESTPGFVIQSMIF